MSDYTYVDAQTGEDVSNKVGGSASSSGQGYIPTNPNQRGDRADLLDKISPEKMIAIFKYHLMGYEFDINTNSWKLNPSLKGHALSEIGASRIASLMLSASTTNISVSNLKDHEIKARLLSICKTAQYMALENWKDFGITGVSQFYFIHEMVFTNTLAVLKQPEGDGIKKLLVGTIHENRIVNDTEQNKKKMFGMFKR